MMKKITQYFIDNSFVVNLISVIIVILGFLSLTSMKRDLISNWETKKIKITVNLSGAGPAQMEKHVTYPIEKAIKNIPAIDKITSRTSQGNTEVTLHLKDDVENITEVEQQAKDEVASIEGDLPSDIENLRVRHIKQTKAWFNYYSILGFDENSDKHQAWLLRTKEYLSRISGIASIDTYNWTKDLYIKINPASLGRYEISINEIYKQINESFKIQPIGSIKKKSQEYSIEIENLNYSVEAIKNISLRSNSFNNSLKLSDIAEVEYRLPKRTRRNLTMGKDSISFNIYKDFDTDSITLKETLESKIEVLNTKAPKGLKIISVEDGPAFIVRQINALKSNALFGGLLVIGTLCLFLGLRNAVMTSFGLPLAYLFTFIVLENLNISIDLISVVGLLLVIGIIVDDAIIISEQYMQNLESGQLPRDAATNAVMRTWKPICGAVATTLIAFAPILMGSDSMSNILWAIPVVVFTALGISLLESFFILPNHLTHYVKKAKSQEDSKLFMAFKNKYEKLLKLTLRYRYIVLSSFMAIMIGSVYFASNNINFNFNLNISSESISFIGQLKESSSIEESKKKIKLIEDVIAKIPKNKYKLYEVNIGQNYTNGKRMSGPEYFKYRISFSQLDQNLNENKKFVNDFLKSELETLKKSEIFERLEVKIHKGGRDETRENIVELTMSSLNPFNVDEVTKEVKSIIEKQKIEGIKSVDLDESLFKDAWVFKPNLVNIQATGLSLNDISSQLVLYVRKPEVYEHNLGNKTIKLYSYFEDGENLNLEELKELPIYLKNGKKLPIKEFGSWFKERREGSIKHSNLMRRVVIDLPFDKEKIKKEALIEKITEIEKGLIQKYPDLVFKTQDADEQSTKNKASMIKKFFYALVGIFFVLALVLRSLIQPFLICMAIPFGVIGVIWAFYFQGLEISLMAIIGIIGMAGVVVNDSLLLVVSVNDKKENWFDFHIPQIVQGSSSRLRAIILTSITTLGGVFPMAYAIGGDAGFTKGLAMSMGWGLFFATVLTLLVLPCMLLVQRDVMVFVERKILKRNFDTELLNTSENKLTEKVLTQSSHSTEEDHFQ
jgi:multidrug efflux pump subunit AcrB